jgi:formylmethanofuran dehydrogenase subunit D
MKLMMNTCRTIVQGAHVERKGTLEYREETSCMRMHPVDMMDLEIEEGATVMVASPQGLVVLHASASKEVEKGHVYVPLGPYANHLIGGETHGTGMPDFKTTSVEVSPTDQEVLPVWKLMECCGGVRYAG